MTSYDDYDACADCGSALDPFGQCFSCDTYGTPAEQRQDSQGNLDARLSSLRPGLPCCGEGGACTGGSRCWHDEPDNIPESWS